MFGETPLDAGPHLRRRIGYLPGELRLDDRLGVDETLRSWSRIRGDVDPTFVAELCERLGLDPGRRVHGLSTGNRRKVGLVGAFMARPDLLVLDEPTSGLDPLVQSTFHELIDEVRADGRTVLLSSHVLSEVQRVADRAVVIRQGRAVAAGTVEALRSAARQRFSVWFTGEPPVAELAAADGVSDVAPRGQEVRGVIEGTPEALLKVLAGHEVDHLLLPEPELEDAFLRFYEERGS